jgi:hypothetical protein
MKTTVHDQELQRRFDAVLSIADQRNAIRVWRDSQHEDVSEDSFLAKQLGERLGVLLQFLSAGRTPSSLALRTWCVLYAVRPDLVGHETIQAAADRFSVSEQRLCQLLKLFRERTGFRYESRVGVLSNEKRAKVVLAMSAARSALAEDRRRLKRFAARMKEPFAS